MPAACQRVTLSLSTIRARPTVPAGYSEISTLVSDNSEACSASSIATLEMVSSTPAATANRSGTPAGAARLPDTAAMTTTTRLAVRRAKTSGHSPA
jgi:hypothetical protein